jgi:hypothetical protein
VWEAWQKDQVARSKDFFSAAVMPAAIGLVVARRTQTPQLFTGLVRLAGELLDRPWVVALPMLSVRATLVAAAIFAPLLASLITSLRPNRVELRARTRQSRSRPDFRRSSAVADHRNDYVLVRSVIVECDSPF